MDIILLCFITENFNMWRCFWADRSQDLSRVGWKSWRMIITFNLKSNESALKISGFNQPSQYSNLMTKHQLFSFFKHFLVKLSLPYPQLEKRNMTWIGESGHNFLLSYENNYPPVKFPFLPSNLKACCNVKDLIFRVLICISL